MKISKLLATRRQILRQAQLSSLAHAYYVLQRLGRRSETARLRGRVRVQPADPRQERYCATLTPVDGVNASVLEEHFTDRDLMALADALVLVLEREYDEVEFSLEDLGEKLAAPLRKALDRAGVVIDLDGSGS